MGSQPESRLSRQIIRELELKGHFAFKIHGGPTMMAGLPDVIACVGGKFYGFEVKLPGRKSTVSTIQAFVGGKIRRAGGQSHVVSSVQEVLGILGEV